MSISLPPLNIIDSSFYEKTFLLLLYRTAYYNNIGTCLGKVFNVEYDDDAPFGFVSLAVPWLTQTPPHYSKPFESTFPLSRYLLFYGRIKWQEEKVQLQAKYRTKTMTVSKVVEKRFEMPVSE